MGTFADEQVLYNNNPSPTTAVGLAQMRYNQTAIRELPGASAPVIVEITDGAIAPTSAFVRVDTEGQAEADELDVISPVLSDTDSLHDGMILYLQAADQDRVVTVRPTVSANGIQTFDGQDVVLNTTTWLVLQLRQGTWYEMRDLFSKTLKDLVDTAQAAADTAQAAATAAQTTADGKANKAMDNITTAGWTTVKNTVLPGAGPGEIKTNFSLPSTGGQVEATWTGYVYLNKGAGGADKYICLRNETRQIASLVVTSFSGGPPLRCFVPVAKGDKVTVDYNATGTTNRFCNVALSGLSVRL